MNTQIKGVLEICHDRKQMFFHVTDKVEAQKLGVSLGCLLKFNLVELDTPRLVRF